MIKKFFYLFLFFCAFVRFGITLENESIFEKAKKSTSLQLLLNDMKLYKLDISNSLVNFHAGDLFEHSIWVYRAMFKLFEKKSFYVEELNLSAREFELVCLAALLHDVGKAGRKELFEESHPDLKYLIYKNNYGFIEKIIYQLDKQEHPDIGFYYLAKNLLNNPENEGLDYLMIDNLTNDLKIFDFGLLYQELGLSTDEQKLLAILVGMHYDFGFLRQNKITNQQFIEKIQKFAEFVNYKAGQIDKKIVHLSVLIQVADVKGLISVKNSQPPLFAEIECLEKHKTTDQKPFEAFGYKKMDDYAGTAFKNLMNYFERTSTSFNTCACI